MSIGDIAKKTRQIALQLDQLVVAELTKLDDHVYPECTKDGSHKDMSIERKELCVAEHLESNRRWFASAHIWPAVRAQL